VANIVEIKGLRELGESMKALSAEVNTRLCATATNKGAQLIKEMAIAKAPEWPLPHMLDGVLVPPGNLKKNIVVKKIKSPLTAEYIVTVRGKRKDAYAARYGRLVEFGTVKMGANSFLRSSFDTGKEEAAQIIAAELAGGLTRAIRKASR